MFILALLRKVLCEYFFLPNRLIFMQILCLWILQTESIKKPDFFSLNSNVKKTNFKWSHTFNEPTNSLLQIFKKKNQNEQNKLIISHKPRLIFYKKKAFNHIGFNKAFFLLKTLYAETTWRLHCTWKKGTVQSNIIIYACLLSEIIEFYQFMCYFIVYVHIGYVYAFR